MAKTTKDVAQRIDPAYFGRPHPFRSRRRVVTWAFFGVSLLWIALVAVSGHEQVYASGPVSVSHALFGASCEKCHIEPFGSVQDAACRGCHQTVASHVPPQEGTDPSCASCHIEHRGGTALQAVEDAHCTDCHHGGTTSFGNHAPFALRRTIRHIHFDHAAHLEPDLRNGPLSCASCHESDVFETGFLEISHDSHCSSCHPLGFDVDFPEERVPHGLRPPELRSVIEAFYLGVLLEDPKRIAVDDKRPVPGREGPAPPPSWVRALTERTETALRILADPGRKSGCFVCHTGDSGSMTAAVTWTPHVIFNHKTHRTVDCAQCHDVANNADADQLALPKIETCRECHKPGGARTSCTTCHRYH